MLAGLLVTAWSRCRTGTGRGRAGQGRASRHGPLGCTATCPRGHSAPLSLSLPAAVCTSTPQLGLGLVGRSGWLCGHGHAFLELPVIFRESKIKGQHLKVNLPYAWQRTDSPEKGKDLLSRDTS